MALKKASCVGVVNYEQTKEKGIKWLAGIFKGGRGF